MKDGSGVPSAQLSAGKADVSREAAANYVAGLSAELATLARRHRLDALSFILDMARLEAESVSRHVNGRP